MWRLWNGFLRSVLNYAVWVMPPRKDLLLHNASLYQNSCIYFRNVMQIHAGLCVCMLIRGSTICIFVYTANLYTHTNVTMTSYSELYKNTGAIQKNEKHQWIKLNNLDEG